MIYTLGEIMLRISPLDKGERLIQAKEFRIEPGGSEANVAIALSNLGNKVSFITKLPENPLGNKIIRHIQSFTVDTSFIVLGNNRIGTYWTENGIGSRPSNVIYDRDDSAFSNLMHEEIDIKQICQNLEWFHTSGITPAISKNSYELLKRTLNFLGSDYKISIDLNYRSKLWKWLDKKSNISISDIMKELCQNAVLITGNETDFQDALGYHKKKSQSSDGYSEIANKVFNDFKNLKYMAISIRDSHSASENTWSGVLFVRKENRPECYRSSEYYLTNIIDRVGTGDSFSAGIIHGLLNFGLEYKYIVDFAVALSALNHTTKGDASQFKVEDVEHLLKTKGSGRIVR